MFIYLGMMFDESGSLEGAYNRSFSKGRAALYALLRRCSETDISNVYMKCHLFDSLVKPFLTHLLTMGALLFIQRELYY